MKTIKDMLTEIKQPLNGNRFIIGTQNWRISTYADVDIPYCNGCIIKRYMDNYWQKKK